MLLKWTPTCLLLILILLAGSCNGRGSATPEISEAAQPSHLAPPPAHSVALADLEKQIREAAPPPGIEADVYKRLKEQLIAVLRDRGASKVVSEPPLGEINKIKDLRLYGTETSEFRLEFTYLNVGDLNLDGLVSINDLTPIGLRFGEDVNGENWIVACRADGNCDGVVDISDITPIGQNYEAYCTGYNIYGAENSTGPWTLLVDLPLPKAPPTGLLELSYVVPGGDYWYYQVRPHDAEGTEGVASEVSRPTLEPVPVELGLDSFLVEQEITPSGGSLETDLGSPAQHIKLTFPEGALAEALSVRIGTNDGNYTPYMGELKSPIVAFDFGGALSLQKPVTMEVKFDRDDILKSIVPFTVDDEGGLHLVDVIAMKSPEFVAEFQTNALLEHMLWLVQQPELGIFDGEIRSTEFEPAHDSFQVDNDGSYWNEKGESFGMSAFAGWYHSAGFTWSEGELYPRFMYHVFTDQPGIPPHAQEVIACRAHISMYKKAPYYWQNFISQQTELNDAQRFGAVVNGIANAGHPVLVNIRTVDYYGIGLVVLAYAYDMEGLYIYDPDFPGEERYIHMNFDNGHFDPYRGCESIRYAGPGAVEVDEPFFYILLDAKSGFADEGGAEVYISSPHQNDHVPVGDVTVTGYIECTEVIVDQLWVYVDDVGYKTTVPPEGTFSITVPVTAGEEFLWFHAWGWTTGGWEKVYGPKYLRLVGD